ncbi:hypothetical protein BS17DRAFT_408865 [Gyrodon lividus]|nr:hypothetical protein BS17DRAFT_408865 [Gyrodon lividus]
MCYSLYSIISVLASSTNKPSCPVSFHFVGTAMILVVTMPPGGDPVIRVLHRMDVIVVVRRRCASGNLIRGPLASLRMATND